MQKYDFHHKKTGAELTAPVSKTERSFNKIRGEGIQLLQI